MPTLEAVSAMIVADRIDKAIKAKFDPEVQKDAYHFLNLAGKGGNNWIFNIYISFGCGMIVFMSLMLSLENLIVALLSGIIATGITIYLLRKGVKRARRELDLLVKSDPDYWNPIAAQLRQIVLGAGAINDPLFGKIQVTKVNQ